MEQLGAVQPFSHGMQRFLTQFKLNFNFNSPRFVTQSSKTTEEAVLFDHVTKHKLCTIFFFSFFSLNHPILLNQESFLDIYLHPNSEILTREWLH